MGLAGRCQAVLDVGVFYNSREANITGKWKSGEKRGQQVPRQEFSNPRTMLQNEEFSLILKGLLGP